MSFHAAGGPQNATGGCEPPVDAYDQLMSGPGGDGERFFLDALAGSAGTQDATGGFRPDKVYPDATAALPVVDPASPRAVSPFPQVQLPAIQLAPTRVEQELAGQQAEQARRNAAYDQASAVRRATPRRPAPAPVATAPDWVSFLPPALLQQIPELNQLRPPAAAAPLPLPQWQSPPAAIAPGVPYRQSPYLMPPSAPTAPAAPFDPRATHTGNWITAQPPGAAVAPALANQNRNSGSRRQVNGTPPGGARSAATGSKSSVAVTFFIIVLVLAFTGLGSNVIDWLKDIVEAFRT